ncbi:hypothetical protein ACX0HA_07065 [Flavobacterium hauense]
MERKYLLYFLLIVVFLLGSFNCKAQFSENEVRDLLLKIDESLGSIKTVVYKIDHNNKALSLRDTLHTTAICSLYIAPKDNMKAYNIVDLEFYDSKGHTYGHRRYDGKRAFWVNYSVDSLSMDIQPDIESKKKIAEGIVDNYSKVLLREYLFHKKPFGRYESSAGMIKVDEEIFKNIPVYVLTIKFKDHDDVRDNVEKHYIRKSDLLPIAHSDFLRWENMEQYNYYEVNYLAINPNIPLEEFTVAKNETINAEERYKMFQQKSKVR